MLKRRVRLFNRHACRAPARVGWHAPIGRSSEECLESLEYCALLWWRSAGDASRASLVLCILAFGFVGLDSGISGVLEMSVALRERF